MIKVYKRLHWQSIILYERLRYSTEKGPKLKRYVKHPYAMLAHSSNAAHPVKSLGFCGFARAFWVSPIVAILFIVSFVYSSSDRVLAADNAIAGSDPAHSLFPRDSWVALKNGEQQWYAFRDEGDDTPIVVRMTVLPEQGATFRVITAEGVRAWKRSAELQPIGAGSVLELFPNDRYWTGSFVQSGTYYVLVESQARGPSNYKLTITGRGVSFPLLSFSNQYTLPVTPADGYPIGNTPEPQFTAPITSQIRAATEQAEVPDQPNSSPEHPLPPVGKTASIAPSETQWYGFRDEGDESTIQVSADATPDPCLAFEVWTPEQLRLWQLGTAFVPIGQGTANPSLNADLFWAGSFVKSGIYYVVVKRDPAVNGACTYQLQVMGDDVSLLLPD